jgi:4'-phosphopantetheinyl transferase
MFANELPQCYAMLSDSEHARAASFESREHLEAYVIRRGLLRSLLAHYLAVSPAAIEFREGPTGKPEVIMPSGRGSIHFSLSHSGQLAVYALRHYGPVGVDVEVVRPLRELPDLASRCFTERELQSFHAAPEKEKLTAFFSGWTRKEAVLKATGQGIAEAMKEVEVNLAPGEAVRVLRFSGEEVRASRWSLHALAPAHSYVAALAYEGAALELKCWSFPH